MSKQLHDPTSMCYHSRESFNNHPKPHSFCLHCFTRFLRCSCYPTLPPHHIGIALLTFITFIRYCTSQEQALPSTILKWKNNVYYFSFSPPCTIFTILDFRSAYNFVRIQGGCDWKLLLLPLEVITNICSSNAPSVFH